MSLLMNRVVLVVDDDPDICWALQHVVEGLQAQCIRAIDCQGALEAARLSRLALVLLDAKLPDIDGLELARRIRRAAPGVPMILISGYFYKDDSAIQAALEQGLIDQFVEKPFSHKAIIGAMKTALCSREVASELCSQEVASEAAEPLLAC